MTFSATEAREHIASSADCMTDSLANLKRVTRKFPDTTPQFAGVVQDILRVREQLKQLEAKFKPDNITVAETNTNSPTYDLGATCQ
ncbi:hypothetical protein [Noviherbaspirillum pedocola]|uniref:Uncharacterized protein n=1 Tax=Noviherbaspirillum pedocola TaxID=2801341 RepID=A0A934SSQ1_9BURK|nr:hypothetical protein [Noviherbaspirillum pedocola]MBK4736066.1 hypothetical protein [Noviherbaspirillum pedocola]